MIRGRAKLVSLLKVRGINVRARIDDEQSTAGRDFNTQSIVVPVRTAAIDPSATGVETKIEIAIPHNVNTGLRKRLRNRGLRFQRWIVKDGRADVQKICVIVGAATHNRQN